MLYDAEHWKDLLGDIERITDRIQRSPVPTGYVEFPIWYSRLQDAYHHLRMVYTEVPGAIE